MVTTETMLKINKTLILLNVFSLGKGLRECDQKVMICRPLVTKSHLMITQTMLPIKKIYKLGWAGPHSRFLLGFRLGCPMSFPIEIPHSLKYCSILVVFSQIKFKSLSLQFGEDRISGCWDFQFFIFWIGCLLHFMHFGPLRLSLKFRIDLFLMRYSFFNILS